MLLVVVVSDGSFRACEGFDDVDFVVVLSDGSLSKSISVL